MAQLGHPVAEDLAGRRLAGNDGTGELTILVAEDDSGVCAVVAGNLLTILSDASPVLLISAMIVDSARRGRGLGRQLVNGIERWGRGRGARRCLVTTALQRADAHSFYESLGYAFTGRRYARSLE